MGKTYLISRYSILHTGVTIRVKVVCPNEDLLLPSRYGKWTDTCHNIANDLSRLERLYKSFMFRLEPTIPVHFRIVKSEYAIPFAVLNLHIILAVENLVLKSSKFGLFANKIYLVDDGSYAGIFVSHNLCNDLFVREVSLSYIQMCYLESASRTILRICRRTNMSNDRKSNGYLIHIIRKQCLHYVS